MGCHHNHQMKESQDQVLNQPVRNVDAIKNRTITEVVIHPGVQHSLRNLRLDLRWVRSLYLLIRTIAPLRRLHMLFEVYKEKSVVCSAFSSKLCQEARATITHPSYVVSKFRLHERPLDNQSVCPPTVFHEVTKTQ